MKQVASPHCSVIFKKAFSDLEIFEAFVHDITGIPIEIDQVETEKSFALSSGRVTPRYDLFVEITTIVLPISSAKVDS